MESPRVLNWRPLDYTKQLKEEVLLTMESHKVLNWKPLDYPKQLKKEVVLTMESHSLELETFGLSKTTERRGCVDYVLT